MQLRFASFAVANLREDFHLQDRAHAGRTAERPGVSPRPFTLGGHRRPRLYRTDSLTRLPGKFQEPLAVRPTGARSSPATVTAGRVCWLSSVPFRRDHTRAGFGQGSPTPLAVNDVFRFPLKVAPKKL